MDNIASTTVVWKPEDVDFVFQSYLVCEKKFVDILGIFPLTPENEKSWSPELVNLFLDVCGLADSVSRQIVGQGKTSSDMVQIKNASGESITKRVGDLNIEDFEENFFNDSHITNSRVILYVYPLKTISPYRDYRTGDGWWTIYNQLKHNRISHYSKANLENTRNALAGLFLILARYRDEEFTRALLRFSFLETSWAPEFAHGQRGTSHNQIWYDSELFGTHDSADLIPSDNVNEINPFLASKKFQLFVGRINP